MNSPTDSQLHENRRVKPFVYIAALIINILVFAFIGTVYLSSTRSYSVKLFDGNIHSVENLNAASANAAYTYANGMGVKIDDIVNYIEDAGLNYADTVRYLGRCNTDPDRQIQLVLCGSYGSTGKLSFGDYSGISVRTVRTSDGGLETHTKDIQYGSSYYDIFRSFTDVKDEDYDGVCFAPEFTDPDTKLKCFAVYRHVDITNSDGHKALYAVLLAINSKLAQSAYDMQKEYDGQSTVLVNADGDYIIKNSEYRNVNFFDYIVNYNGLSLARKTQLQQEIIAGTAAGAPVNIYYKNHQGADCVFSVTAMENGWYSITCVPLSSFSQEDGTVDYTLIILMLFLALFITDGLTIFFVGRMLRENVAVAETAMREANEANRAKSRFLSTMSHELRTPLNAIIGLVALCGDSLTNRTVLRDYLKKIDISSKLLLQLISDILDVSAIESNKLKLNTGEFDMTRLITSLSAIYYDQCASKGIDFGVTLKNMHSEKLIGDSVRVNQVLLNFLSNAVKFTPSGGRVTLSAEQTARTDSSVTIRFAVSDTGCGISDELRTRLFKPFERAAGEAARRYSGTGLGLSIAKNLTELMHGEVRVESTEGAGSVFYAEIPFGIPAEKTEKSFSPITDLRVLAAVSDADESEYIGQILTGFGVESKMTGSAGEALALMNESAKSESPYNLCILDWKLSDLSGIDAARKIRASCDAKAVHIILLAYDLAKASEACTETGADRVCGKPVFPSVLYNVLEEVASDQTRAMPVLHQDYELAGKRVLLVEDNALNTEIAKMLLNRIGVDVDTAQNGQLGRDRFVQSKPGRYDAILMDVQMPIMDGYEATLAIRRSAHPQAKTIPILAMTADAFTEDVEKAHSAGMNEHIAKPVVPDNLYAVLKKFLF